MPQMRAQHVAFAVLAVRLKLSVFTSSALAFQTVLVRQGWRFFKLSWYGIIDGHIEDGDLDGPCILDHKP
jgi:hypothetical protein